MGRILFYLRFAGGFLAKGRLRTLASVRCSVPPCASAIRATDAADESSASRLKHCRKARRKAKPTPMALGCCVGCATKKVSKKVAGNAIPVPDFRRTGKSHIPGSATSTRTSVQSKTQKVLCNPTVIYLHSGIPDEEEPSSVPCPRLQAAFGEGARENRQAKRAKLTAVTYGFALGWLRTFHKKRPPPLAQKVISN